MPKKPERRSKKTLPPQKPPKPVELNAAEKALMAADQERREAAPGALKWKCSNGERGPGLMPDNRKGEQYAWAALTAATGTVDNDLAVSLLMQAANATIQPFDEHMRYCNVIAAAMTGLAPKNETEGLLVAQMTAAHNSALECLRRANLQNQTFEGRKLNLTFADRFMRTFAVQVEALARLRKGGQQKVVVEHVHVYPGGQAIVGNVSNPGGRDGTGIDGSTPCPCAIEAAGEAIPFCPGQGEAVRSALQEDGLALPSTGDAERSL